MHELAVTQDIVDAVLAHTGDAPVKHIVLEIGRLSGVSPEAVQFCFDLCTEDTPLAKATLEVLEVDGLARCRACSAEVTLDRPIGFCRCGSSDLLWLGGDELKIKQVVLE